MEQIELCLLHVYSDSDFILQKAKKHTGHTSLGGQLLAAHPLCGRALPACLPACLPASLPPPSPSHGTALAGHLRWAHLGWAHLGRAHLGQEKGQRSSVAAWDALS